MKIAVPVRNNEVDDHFGHCEEYAIFSVSADNKIENIERLASPVGCGCKSNIAAVLQDMGVDLMLAGNMGNGALNVLHRHGIEVCRGCSGDIGKLVESFLNGELSDSGVGCHQHDHHAEGHQCNH